MIPQETEISEETEILEFNQYKKCDKAPFIIYAYHYMHVAHV